jgi:hypothetical protein
VDAILLLKNNRQKQAMGESMKKKPITAGLKSFPRIAFFT